MEQSKPKLEVVKKEIDYGIFKNTGSTQAFLKGGLLGFQGSGKTHTATVIAMGLHELIKSEHPIFFLDTETGSDWVKPMIQDAGIECFQAKTRAFTDLVGGLKTAQRHGAIVIVDSLTHFWRELCDSYMKKKNRNKLTFPDWNYLKTTWGQFTDLYINSTAHIILCGRAGYEYETEEDEETGKKEMFKSGIKMKAESETGFEPSLLIYMERHMDVGTKKVTRSAHVLKDRSRQLDGATFLDPKFEDFLPHIKFLNLGGEQLGVDVSRTSEDLIDDPKRDGAWRAKQSGIVLDEIETILVEHYPSTKAEDKQAKIALLKEFFETASWERIKTFKLEALQDAFAKLKAKLEPSPLERPSSEVEQPTPGVALEDDQLPGEVAQAQKILGGEVNVQ